MKLKINGLIDKPLWKNMKCVCSKTKDDIENKFPIIDCKTCKFQAQENSMPKESFISQDSKGKDVEIKTITIVRGNRYEDIIGWTF